MPKIEAAAEAEHRPAGDLLRAVIERGLSEQRCQAHAEREEQPALALGIFGDEDDQPIDEYRQTLPERVV